MALVQADCVYETTTTTGTGTINLGGAVTGFQSFVSGVGNGNTTYYCTASGSNWEVGIGTVTSGTPNTLARTTILPSSNSGSAITLAGTSIVFATAPAALLRNSGLFGPTINRPIPTSTNTGLTTWVKEGGATVSDTAAGIALTKTDEGGSLNICARSESAPSTPYTVSALVVLNFKDQNWNSAVGIGWYDRTKIHGIEIQ